MGKGFYGGMSEESMMKEIRVRGPILFDFNAGAAFMSYKSGVMSDEGQDALETQFNENKAA